MKIVKIILIIAIIIVLTFVGYRGYLAYQKWQNDRFSEINMLRANQDMFLKKVTDLSTAVTRIVNDTIKTTIEVKPDHTYEALKDEVIELKKDETANKEEIEKLKEELSIQRQAFLARDDTILIKTTDDDTLLIYRDTEGTLQPASDNIEKIIEHRELSSVVPILAEEEIEIKGTRYNLKAGGFYSLDGSYGAIISKSIFTIWDLSLNASLLLSDFEDFKFAVGGDIAYEINDGLELGVGYSTDNQYYIKLQYQF